MNYIVDIGSRWGNKYSGGNVNLGMSVGPHAVVKTFLMKGVEDLTRSKCVLRLPQPKVHSEWNTPDIDSQKDLGSQN